VTAKEVIDRAPEVIVGSWCGKKFQSAKVASRPGFAGVPAVCRGALHEIKSPLILQPGPAALTDGLAALEAIVAQALATLPVPVDGGLSRPEYETELGPGAGKVGT
jgi:iron complex transport system substrate-binding protein